MPVKKVRHQMFAAPGRPIRILMSQAFHRLLAAATPILHAFPPLPPLAYAFARRRRCSPEPPRCRAEDIARYRFAPFCQRHSFAPRLK